MNKRIIKFKAWSPKEEKMYGVFDLNKEESIMSQTGLPLHIAPQSYFVWLQFTGLKDKNGKEIYEGDIVIIDEDDNENAVIEYIEEDAMFSIKLSNVIENFWNISGDAVEVIGNIYENPELLK